MQDSLISWSAQWISSSVIGGPRITAPVPFLRKAFRVEGPIQSAVLHITALGLYECEINGRLVTDNVFLPGWTEYRKRVPFQSYDVTALLSSGANAIGVILGDGWYAGHVGAEERGLYGQRPQLLAQLEITTQDGKTERIVSDGSWKTTVGPILESDMLMGETYDAQRELPGWSTAACDETGWLPVTLAPDPKIVIDRSLTRPVKRHEILLGREMEYPEYNPRWPVKRYDFGQNITGRLRLTLRGQRGARIEIRHGEILDKGAVYIENLRGARARDSYTLKGGGTETWEPRFTFHGFRYADLRWNGAFEVKIEKIEAVVLHSELPPTGTFRCSHDLLNQLEQNIVWGQKGNFLEVPTDCPQRDERLGWTGDAQVFIRTAAFHMDVQGFFRKWVRDIRDAQAPNGAVPSFVPNTASFDLAEDGGPAWADATFICPWTIYRCYGDVEIVRDHYDSMTRYMDYLEKNKVKDYIRAHPDVDSWGGFGDWLALDGSGRTEGGTPRDLIGTAHYANNARIMAEASDLLGKTVEAKKYRELHGRIVEAFRQRYVTPAGLISSGTQTAYVLALHFNLVPPRRPRGLRARTGPRHREQWHASRHRIRRHALPASRSRGAWPSRRRLQAARAGDISLVALSGEERRDHHLGTLGRLDAGQGISGQGHELVQSLCLRRRRRLDGVDRGRPGNRRARLQEDPLQAAPGRNDHLGRGQPENAARPDFHPMGREGRDSRAQADGASGKRGNAFTPRLECGRRAS